MKAAVHYKLPFYFLSGCPDMSSTYVHGGVSRGEVSAPACLSALSAPVVLLGSCFHDKIFSDSVFAYKLLKI